MMAGQLMTAAIYAVLALVTLAFNWRRRTWPAGVALLVYTLVSSGTFFLVDFEWRVLREIALATLMFMVAFDLWVEGYDCRPCQAVMALCALDVTFCAAICYNSETSYGAQLLFAYGVNVIFIGMCAAIAAPGVRDAFRSWISSIDHQRRSDGETSAFDWLIERGWGDK